jgi:hypothetical protein
MPIDGCLLQKSSIAPPITPVYQIVASLGHLLRLVVQKARQVVLATCHSLAT